GRKNFSLTPEGRALLQASHQVRNILGDVEGRIHNLQNLVAGDLCISTIFSIGLHELPTYLKTFRQAHPQVDVRVEYAAHRRCTSASSMGVPTSVLWPILRRAGDFRLSPFGVTGLCSSVRPCILWPRGDGFAPK